MTTEITNTNSIPPSAMDLILDQLAELLERSIRTETRVCHLLTAQGMDVMGHKMPDVAMDKDTWQPSPVYYRAR